MTKSKQQWQGRTKGGNFGLGFLLWFLKYVNLNVGYFFVAIAIPFYLLLRKKERKAIYSFFRFRIGFPPLKASWYTMRQHYTFGKVLMDKLVALSRGGEVFQIEITGQAEFDKVLSQEKGFIISGAHVGNFELAGYLLRQNEKKTNSVVYGGEEPILQQHRRKQMKHANGLMIPVKKDLSHLFLLNSALDQGEIIIMTCDRIQGSEKHVACDFLGKKAYFPIGGFQLAAMKEVPVLFISVMKHRFKKYHIVVENISAEPKEGEGHKAIATKMARRYVEALERLVIRYPEQWFNFYDFWKYN